MNATIILHLSFPFPCPYSSSKENSFASVFFTPLPKIPPGKFSYSISSPEANSCRPRNARLFRAQTNSRNKQAFWAYAVHFHYQWLPHLPIPIAPFTAIFVAVITWLGISESRSSSATYPWPTVLPAGSTAHPAPIATAVTTTIWAGAAGDRL